MRILLAFLLVLSMTIPGLAATSVLRVVTPADDTSSSYHTITAALDSIVDANRNLVTRDEYVDIEIEGDWSGHDTTESVLLNGPGYAHPWTTDRTTDNYIHIHTTTQSRHNGTAARGFTMAPTAGSAIATQGAIDYRFEGIIFKADWTSGGWDLVSLSGTTGEMLDNIFYVTPETSVPDFALLLLNEGTFWVYNNICYGLSQTGWVGILGNNAAGTHYLYNNTIVGLPHGICRNAGTFTLANNICQTNTAEAYWNINSGTHLTNISDDATSPNVALQNITVVFAGTGDYHLAAGSNAQDQGTDLSANTAVPFTLDIDDQTRTGIWDIGADEHVPTETPGSRVMVY